jgi:secreted trypsin-like serine protease
MHYESELYVVYTSIEDYQEWCDKCIDNHAKHHPIMKDEFWAIGSTDTENNLTIK